MEPILSSIAASIHLVTFKSGKNLGLQLFLNFFKLLDIKSDDSELHYLNLKYET